MVEKLGIPGVFMVCNTFADDAKSAAVDNGMPTVRRREVSSAEFYKLRGDVKTVKPLVEEIRRLVAFKGDGVHDFKFTSAALESFQYISEAWRGRYLACGAMHFSGPEQPDNAIVARAQSALGR